LIEQQIRQQDIEAIAPRKRRSMRACMRSARNCHLRPPELRLDADGRHFWLRMLTAERVETYLRYRLRFCASSSSASGRAFNLSAAS